jgi:uncharacterized surface protein with fasciclin (FAS1) repeats
MFSKTRTAKLASLAAALALPLVLTACSGGMTSSSPAITSAPAMTATAPMSTPAMTTSMGAQPFGTGCASVPMSGKGSFDGMSSDPVATAASNNPLLSTLVTAVTKAGLVDTLNNAKGITVFAPTNDAFAKIDPATLNKVLADKEMLTAILTEHVVGQSLTPDKLAGTFDSLNPKQGVMVSGSGDSFTVNKTAKVVCGNVKTANATVYIIDTVLLPAS